MQAPVREASMTDQKNNFKVWCLLGLPFYAVSMPEVCAWIEEVVQSKRQSILSVTNVNWAALATKDLDFKQDLLLSDLNAVDSRILFWCAGFLGLPLPEQIAGPTIVETLARKKEGELRVFFYGGGGNAAEKAAECLNKERSHLRAVGFCNPGGGSVEQLSHGNCLKKIDHAAPDFLILSISAKKGLAWVHKNRSKLKVPLISYLGAVVNLVAGHVKRAPLFLQKMGFEWVWRIFQEPKLLKRYYEDGLWFLKVLATYILPLKILQLYSRKKENDMRLPIFEIKKNEGKTVIGIKGVCNRYGQEIVRKAFSEAVPFEADIEIDLRETTYIESSFLGELLLLWKEQKEKKRKCTVTGPDRRLQKIFRLYMMNDIFFEKAQV